MDIYRELILEHYKNPSHWGSLPQFDRSSNADNPSCGDSISLDIVTDKGILRDAAFTGEGCAISIASTSLLLDEVIGKSIADIQNIQLADIEKLLGIKISIAREKCATLGLLLLQDLISKEVKG